jgi:hypothetical protein
MRSADQERETLPLASDKKRGAQKPKPPPDPEMAINDDYCSFLTM